MTREELQTLMDNVANVLIQTEQVFPLDFAKQLLASIQDLVNSQNFDTDASVLAAFLKITTDDLKKYLAAFESILTLMINTFGTSSAMDFANFLKKVENRRILMALLAMAIQ